MDRHMRAHTDTHALPPKALPPHPRAPGQAAKGLALGQEQTGGAGTPRVRQEADSFLGRLLEPWLSVMRIRSPL